MFIKLSVV